MTFRSKIVLISIVIQLGHCVIRACTFFTVWFFLSRYVINLKDKNKAKTYANNKLIRLNT